MNPVLAGLKGMMFAKSLKRPVVASFQAHVMEMVKFYGLGLTAEPLWILHRYLYSHADYCLAPSKKVVAELESRGFGDVGLWRRGVDIETFSPDYADDAVRDELSGGNPDRVVLLSVGRLAAEKQVELILPVLQNVPNVHLAIVGDGPYRETLEEVFAGQPCHLHRLQIGRRPQPRLCLRRYFHVSFVRHRNLSAWSPPKPCRPAWPSSAAVSAVSPNSSIPARTATCLTWATPRP